MHFVTMTITLRYKLIALLWFACRHQVAACTRRAARSLKMALRLQSALTFVCADDADDIYKPAMRLVPD